MIVYRNTKSGFIEDTFSGKIADIIEEQFIQVFHRKVPISEKRSWENSLGFMERVLSHSSIPTTAGVGIEFTLPPTSKRIDFILSGKDNDGKSQVYIVELKQWENCEPTLQDGIVKTYLGGGIRETVHPSYQAYSYYSTLNNFNETVYSGAVNLHPCALLHNMSDGTAVQAVQYQTYIEKAPLFLKGNLPELRDHLETHVHIGDNGEAIDLINNGKIRPSKKLADVVANILKGKDEFVLLDDQKVVYEQALAFALKTKKTVIIVEGGPGTGKSVVALNLLIKLIEHRRNAAYVSKNAAPREVYKSRVFGTMTKSRFDSLFLGSGKFMNAQKEAYDCLVVDEAHRLNEKSGLYGNQGENQVKEIIQASNTTVFFIDESQKVSISDIGTKEEIEHWAFMLDAKVIHTSLQSQFRCNGSDIYLAWLDNTLGIKSTAHPTLVGSDYNFDVVDSPTELAHKIETLDRSGESARMVAGYCYPWKSKKDNTVMDIEYPEYGFAKQWNLATDGSLWIDRASSIDQVGCIHTCQGLEVAHIGVIISLDMRFENGEVITDFRKRDRHDKTIKGAKTLIKSHPKETAEEVDKIIRNTYRTLMTRGMKSCTIWCEDAELNEYFKKVIG